ncbi:DUF2321 domain-containing protein [Enterococcus faecalis]|uniref:DUF2321 domain-containing protein n=1 Tax=Enterococcus faecalis TaxID=1351 RepID=UPI0018913CB8|nr:DUF2321 domain-containing protein [Enterococcus faecalis]QPB60527.1 DUF2321 domain-containing protein [Enterococcus faecalis]
MGQQFQKVCINGHQISVISNVPEDPKEFCEKCGKKLISTCQECHYPIGGYYKVDGILDLTKRTAELPYYCKQCAQPYPWTKLILEGATELLALDDEISETDKELIKTALPDLLVDTPKTKVAEAKFKKGFSRASSLVKDSLYNLLVDVVSETVKKSIFPN